MSEALFVALSVAHIAFGFLLCFAGYRLARFSLVAAAALEMGNYIGTLISVLVNGPAADRSEYWITFVIAGVVFACIAGCHFKSGICLLGFAHGMEFAILVMGMVDSPGSAKMQLLWMAIAGLGFASTILPLKRRGLVEATSFVGMSLLITGIRFFVWRSIAKDDYVDDFASAARSAWWTLTAISLPVLAAGLFIQFAITSRDFTLAIHQQQDEVAEAGTLQYSHVQTPVERKQEQIQGNAITHV